MNIIKILVKIDSIIYSNESGFKICRVTTVDNYKQELTLDKTFFMKGVFSDVITDQKYEITGYILRDENYGEQFNVSDIQLVLDNDEDSLIKYLSSELFPKIGTITAKKIVEKLGIDLIKKVEKDISIIEKELTFLNQEQILTLKNNLLESKYVEELFKFFNNYLSRDMITKIYLTEGVECIEKYKNNPYLVFINYERVILNNLDNFALNILKFEKNNFYRIEVYIYYLLKTLNSHTYITKKELLNQLSLKGINAIEEINDAIISLSSSKLLYFDEESERISFMEMYNYEKSISFNVKRLLSSSVNNTNISKDIFDLETKYSIEYSDKQKEAINNVFSNPISIITGGPGTGKTTIIKAITSIFEKTNKKEIISLVAPTGKAASRMKEVTGINAQTIHSHLQINQGDRKAKYNSYTKLDSKLIILDEASMVDTEIFSKLFEAIEDNTHFVIIGDVNQLSSVGPGQVLLDLISSSLITITKLDVIQRQGFDSSVINLSQQILNNDLNKNFFKEKTSDFEYYQISDNQSIDAIKQILYKEFEQYKKEDIQILTPRRRSSTNSINSTVTNLNSNVQQIFNKETNYLFSNGYTKFYENDRVINNENIKEKNIANGDQGYLRFPIFKNNKLQHLSIEFDELKQFSKEELKSIDLSYATTVHKSQGSEYKLVIMLLLPQHGKLVSKKLIYTGITRAKQKLIILGNYDFIENSIINSTNENRKTNLIELLV